MEQANRLNFEKGSKFRSEGRTITEQEELLRAGEQVSKQTTWKISKNTGKTEISEGAFSIFEFDSGAKLSDASDLIHPLVHPDDLEMVLEEFHKIRNDKQARTFEHRIVLPSGKIKWLKVTKGEFNFGEEIFGTVQDISTEKKMALELESYSKKLKSKNEELKQFAYASSHDLQEPLRTITGL